MNGNPHRFTCHLDDQDGTLDVYLDAEDCNGVQYHAQLWLDDCSVAINLDRDTATRLARLLLDHAETQEGSR